MQRSKRWLILFAVALVLITASAKVFLDSIYRLPILMYHSIGYGHENSDRMTVSPLVFGKQMKYLRDKGYNVITLEKAVEYIKQRSRPPSKTVAITIDDGYKNNYKFAYPILARYKIPATIFVIIELVGKQDFLDWTEIKEMSDLGLIDIESHTMSHPWLTGVDDERLKMELVESRKILGTRLGKDVKFLCYPMGGYDERVKKAVRDAGYEAAFATKPTKLAPNYDIYEIKRVRISPSANNLFVFWIKTSGYHAFFRVIQGDYRDIPYILWKRRS